jgi:alkylhydroperoxidase family enzyme
MFLKEVEAATPLPPGLPGILRLFGFAPETTKHLIEFTQAVMRGESELPIGLRELIAARTSQRNDCPF